MPSDYKSTVLADTPIIYWRHSVVDTSGHSRDGTAGGSGVTQNSTGGPLSGQTSGYIGFPGTGYIGYFSGLVDYLNGRTSFSIETWVKFTKGNDILAVLAGWTGGTSYLIIDTGEVVFQVHDSSGTQAGSSALNDGNWHYIVGVYTGTQAILYVDNVAVDTETTSGALTSTGSQHFLAGGDPGGDTDDVTASTAEIAVYAQALSATRIAAHYAASNYVAPGSTVGNASRNWFCLEEE